MFIYQQLKICYKQLNSNNEKNLNNFLNKLQSKNLYLFHIRFFLYEVDSSAPIVPISPSTTDFQFDQKSSSMVKIKNLYLYIIYFLS